MTRRDEPVDGRARGRPTITLSTLTINTPPPLLSAMTTAGQRRPWQQNAIESTSTSGPMTTALPMTDNVCAIAVSTMVR